MNTASTVVQGAYALRLRSLLRRLRGLGVVGAYAHRAREGGREHLPLGEDADVLVHADELGGGAHDAVRAHRPPYHSPAVMTG